MSEALPANPTPVGITLPAACGPLVPGWCPGMEMPPGVCRVDVSQGNPALVVVCPGAQAIGPGLFPDRTISVTGPAGEIPPLHVVMKFNHPADSSDDAYLAIATHAWSSSYRALGYAGFVFAPETFPSRYAVIADDNIPDLVTEDCAGLASPPFFLPAGNVFQQTCFDDISGRRIHSAGGHKFAVISGSTGSRVPVGVTFGDVLMDMLPPPDFWPGSEYFTTEFNKKRPALIKGDLFQIMALELPVTITEIDVAVPGVVREENSAGKTCPIPLPPAGHTIPAGDYCDVSIGSSVSGQFYGGRIRSSGEKFMVGHYMKGRSQTNSGDASMALLVPAERFRCAHRFFSFKGFNFDPPSPLIIDGTYVNIVARTAIIGTVQLDGGPLPPTCLPWQALPPSFSGVDYSWRLCRLPDPCTTLPLPGTCPFGEEHTLTATEGIGVYAYGQRDTGAYAYATGFTIPQ